MRTPDHTPFREALSIGVSASEAVKKMPFAGETACATNGTSFTCKGGAGAFACRFGASVSPPLRLSDQFRPLDRQIADSLTRGSEDRRGERRGHDGNAGFPDAGVRGLGLDYGYVDLPRRLFQSRDGVIVKIGLRDPARIGGDFAHQSQRSTENRRAFKLRAHAVGHHDLANVGNRPNVGNGEIPLAVDGDFDRRGDVAQKTAVSRDADGAIRGVRELRITRFFGAPLENPAQAAGVEREGLRGLTVIPT